MQLHAHQNTAVRFLTERQFALLWDDPGLGKTYSAVAAAAALRLTRILVICPAAVREHWARSFNTAYPGLPVYVHEGFAKQIVPGANIVSHANFVSPAALAAIIAGGKYNVMILDESHEARVFTASRTRNLFSKAEPSFVGHISDRLWALTGTPLVNSACDLWPILNHPLGKDESWWDFGSYFAEMRPDPSVGYKAVGIRHAAELAAFLRPHVLRRTAQSIGLNLPPLAVNSVALPLAPGALAEAMSGLARWTPAQLTQALETQDELRDADMSRVRHALGLAKAPAVAWGVNALLQQDAGPLVLFFQHTAVRDALRAALSNWRIGVIDGKTSRVRIEDAERAHQAGCLDLLLVQTQAGSLGLTLTRGCRAIVAELPWTATALQQAIARVHRMTQIHPVTADVLRAEGCWLEDVLSTIVGRKQRASEELLGLLTTAA